MAIPGNAKLRAAVAAAAGAGAYGAWKFGETHFVEKQRRRTWTQPYDSKPTLGAATAAKLARHARALERGIRGGIFYRTESGMRKYVKR